MSAKQAEKRFARAGTPRNFIKNGVDFPRTRTICIGYVRHGSAAQLVFRPELKSPSALTVRESGAGKPFGILPPKLAHALHCTCMSFLPGLSKTRIPHKKSNKTDFERGNPLCLKGT